jgi:single-stranded DNA-binding protein
VNPITNVQIIGTIESVERKRVNEKALAEFRIEGVGLRISAWEQRADQVPDHGIVIVNGYLRTRSYTYEGAERTATEITANSIQVIDSTPAVDTDLPF